MNLGIATAIAYGILTFVGGIIGYAKAQSKASLISGSLSGLLLIFSGIVQLQGQSWGLILATVVAAVLVIVFIARLVKTKKLMPAGLMIAGGIVSLALLVYQLSTALEPTV
ncbi:TMEM14 family protein [Kamptonema sp. UHCC 0994]|uniref:TMEM14 family protein n=1 Tax=Kamptonema sp. UHCC 0994 TaxID=3031329 RepID=UPI0023BA17D5|nr:TMEM14 family protein [Kamptonema sp. UHCC 0994]MDF0555398.1 TMEM14 family protein [Kamptonema sp. UHCC 0994]